MQWTEILLVILCVWLGLAAVGLVLTALSRKSISGGAGRRGRRRDVVKDLDAAPRSKSEAEVIKFLEAATGKKFPTVNPRWLVWRGRTLELDGYCAELAIAVEFQGPHHRRWDSPKESYTAYFTRVVKDVVKARVCAERGVKLMTIDYTLPRIHWQNYVLSRLQDFGVEVKLTSHQYIRPQFVAPFRQPQLEAELGLTAMMEEAITGEKIGSIPRCGHSTLSR